MSPESGLSLRSLTPMLAVATALMTLNACGDADRQSAPPADNTDHAGANQNDDAPVMPARPARQMEWYHLTLSRAAFDYNNPDQGGDVPLVIGVAVDHGFADYKPTHLFTLHNSLWRGTMDRFEDLDLSVDAQGLQGQFMLWYDQRAIPFELTIERTGNDLQGTYRARPAEGAHQRLEYDSQDLPVVTGEATGQVVTAASLAETNAFASPLRWPAFTARAGAANSSQSFALIDDAQDLKIHWRSEAIWGPVFRPCRLDWPWLHRTPSGGPASVIGDDGILFISHRRPRAQQIDGDGQTIPCFRQDLRGDDQSELAARLHDDLGWSPAQVASHIGVAADEVVTAIDATTGQTLWETTWEGAGINFFAARQAPNNLTGTVDKKRVYSVDSLGMLRALDRYDGSLLWERQLPYRQDRQYGRVTNPYSLQQFYDRIRQGGSFDFDEHRFGHGLTTAEDYVIAPRHDGPSGLIAYEGAYGLTLWTIHETIMHAQMTPLTWFYESQTPLESQDYLITIDNDGVIHLVDAKIGRVLWRHDTEWADHGQPLLVDDLLLTHAGAYRISRQGAEPQWDARGCVSAHRRAAIVIGDQAFLRCNLAEEDGDFQPTNCGDDNCTVQVRDLHTGEIRREFQDPARSRYAHGFALGPYLVLEKESNDSSLQWAIYDSQPPSQEPLLELSPPFRFQSMDYSYRVHPSAEGRVFVRGETGIFAIDLRQ